MKKLGIFAFAALLFVGLTSCEPKGEATEGGTETTAATAGTEGTAAAVNPSASAETNATPASTMALSSIDFPEDSYNFGEIAQGDKVKHTFRFTNTGSNPLLVENVKPSCGCTASDYSKEEIAPGAEGFVEIEFDSKGKNGVQKKSVTVTTNTEPRNTILNFTGEVIKE